MSKDKTIVRTRKNRENPYVMIDKYGINDNRLSLKSKGLLCYLLSKPDDWTIYMVDLVKCSADGRDSVRSALKELQDCGYLSMQRIRDEKGRLKETEYIVYERPIEIEEEEEEEEKPCGSKSQSKNGKSNFGKTNFGKTYFGESPPTNNDLTNNDLTNNDLTNNNNKKPVKKEDNITVSNGVISPPKQQNVVVDSQSKTIQSILEAKGIQVSNATLIRWKKKASYETIIQVIEETLEREDIKNVIGYITGILEKGYTPASASPAKKKRGDLPEYQIRQQETKTTSATELTEEQQQQAMELLRALGEIE